jgi:hypothetical protein
MMLKRIAAVAATLAALLLVSVQLGGASEPVDTDRQLADKLYGDYGPCPEGEAGPTLQWEDTVDQYENVSERAQLMTVTEPIDQVDIVDVTLADGTGVVCAPGTGGLLWTGITYRVIADGTSNT